MKCDRCGKEISDNDCCYTVNIPDINSGVEVSVWCENCHDEFVDSLKVPSKVFEDVKPATIDIEKIKKVIEKF